MSRSALGAAVGVSAQTIYRWETGATTIPLTQARRLSEVLCIALRLPCPACALSLHVRGGEAEPALGRDLLGLIHAAYMISDDLPCAAGDDARRIQEIASLLESALDLIESTLPDLPESLSLIFEE